MTDVSNLPALLADLVEPAGLARVIAFARELGGKRISVPKRCKDDHRLVALLGRAGADRLCEMYGGETSVQVPMGPAGTLAEARQRTVRALEDGSSIDGAAGAGGLHRRTAQRLRARLKTPSNGSQGSLF